MRPEPVVLRRLAFSPQLTVEEKSSVQLFQSPWTKNLHAGHVVIVFFHPHFHIHFDGSSVRVVRTLAGLSGRVTAVGAGRLLDVEGPLA